MVNAKLVMMYLPPLPNLTPMLAFFSGTATSRLHTDYSTDYAPVKPETAFSTPGRMSCTPTVRELAASLISVTFFRC
jgi:hypothetical protein